MWVPSNAEEIEAAAASGNLEETATFDAKESLPAASKNATLAIDVAAMSTDGGVLLYGLGEDDEKRLTKLRPVDLAGAAERISQIVSTSIDEVPEVEIRTYPVGEAGARGYVAVIVPPSPRAPHQVIVKNERRFYGREAKANRVLAQGEIARLYARREEWARNRETLLAEVIAGSALPPQDGHGFLYAFAHPVVQDESLIAAAIDAIGDRLQLASWLRETASSSPLSRKYEPSIRSAGYLRRHGADAWRLSTVPPRERKKRLAQDPTDFVDFDSNFDGRGQVYFGRATDYRGEGERVVFEVGIAGTLETFFTLMSALYGRADYFGQVDIGVAVTGLQGAVSLAAGSSVLGHPEPYAADRVVRTTQLPAQKLSESRVLVVQLLGRLFESTTGWDGWTPYAELG